MHTKDTSDDNKLESQMSKKIHNSRNELLSEKKFTK